MTSKLTDLQIRNAKPKAKRYTLAAGHGLTLLVEYERILTEASIERGDPWTIAPSIDLTDDERRRSFAELDNGRKPCIGTTGVLRLDTAALTSILTSCSKAVGQSRRDAYTIKWKIEQNLRNASPWPLITILAAVCSWWSVLCTKEQWAGSSNR